MLLNYRILFLSLFFGCVLGTAARPHIVDIKVVDEQLHIESSLPEGYDYVVLRQRDEVFFGGIVLLAGDVPVGAESVRFVFPIPESQSFFFVEGGHGDRPPAALTGSSQIVFQGGPPGGGPMPESWRYHHTLNRLGYGPKPSDLEYIKEVGIESYIEEQLRPETVVETDRQLEQFHQRMLHHYEPGRDTVILPRRQEGRYFKGTQAPPSGWRSFEFQPADAGWRRGKLPIGRGPSVATHLEDMQQVPGRSGYVSVFMQIEFEVEDPSLFERLVLKVFYDDGFVAFLNGQEVARANIKGSLPRYNAPATEKVVDSPLWEEFPVSPDREQLRSGRNVLSFQMHNSSREDFDSYFDASLVSREYQPEYTRIHIDRIESLKDLLHLRGVYSKRQLQAVLGEFWENHFTTDYDKVVQYFDELEDGSGNDLMTSNQAAYEAVQIEHAEYEFFYQNALGNFGDLLLFSATSPSQLIYLDNVLNRVGEANENYAREILELFSFGVDNRYTQSDIEALARAFTGWQIRKVRPENLLPFPESARRPLTRSSSDFVEREVLSGGPGWKYYVGIRQPLIPGRTGKLDWTRPVFSDSSWKEASTPFGFDELHSAVDKSIKTDVSEIRSRYASAYLRRAFKVESPSELENLFLAINYDDGYIAYLNGFEIGRSATMPSSGTPSATFVAQGIRSATDPTEYVDATHLIRRLRRPPNSNVLAIQVHNRAFNDDTLYLDARLVTRVKGPSAIELDDVNGLWTFRFNPEDHDFEEKRIFEGTPYEIRTPAGREGVEGVDDALRVIDAIVNHPSTAEFICLKLVNRFVSDDITLDSYHQKSANPGLLSVMDRAIEAWNETEPAGNIGHVLRSVFLTDPSENYFWSRDAYQSKIKTPIEFVNSSLRIFEWRFKTRETTRTLEGMGMHFFTRNDPDGWSEKGFDWMSTGGLLNRVKFAAALPRNAEDQYFVRLHMERYLQKKDLVQLQDIVNYFDELVLAGQMTTEERDIIFDIANRRTDGTFSRFRHGQSDTLNRLIGVVGLILASPQFQFQ